ncbi:hypothetical protein [Longimicrobium sp.]|uniref:hypothetical protein n=1 Tax=Longimicrobium sp. TaxID=2029185 RepID=UPI002E377E3B|nr:hypothetical protein [Longimicrobium sp.]HEX6039482.1 hypothetical protein [Longimicrobium sp.]
MRKLKLNLEALTVESFGTARPANARGTIQAHQVQQGPMDTYADSEATACTCDTQGSTMWTNGYDCNSYRFC